jgi:hypothetical protein
MRGRKVFNRIIPDSLTVARALYKVAALNCSERLIMLCDGGGLGPLNQNLPAAKLFIFVSLSRLASRFTR